MESERSGAVALLPERCKGPAGTALSHIEDQRLSVAFGSSTKTPAINAVCRRMHQAEDQIGQRCRRISNSVTSTVPHQSFRYAVGVNPHGHCIFCQYEAHLDFLSFEHMFECTSSSRDTPTPNIHPSGCGQTHARVGSCRGLAGRVGRDDSPFARDQSVCEGKPMRERGAVVVSRGVLVAPIPLSRHRRAGH
jgi:hypothetical protein